ncbi:uncharacterized protein [Diadema setosum]|uniref:uncharacterized protein n=1 Tax=Diadema setosum TaxID=31175 RepID=UPI003B3BCD70
MMMPPNKGVRAASKYKSLIKARVPPKKNSERKSNSNSHFYSARVRYCMEMAAKLGDRAVVISADNKNKVRVCDNTPAVDRRLAIRRFYPADDSPIYLDHDFPTPGYAITPAGYLELRPLSTPQLTIDHLGRQQYVVPEKKASTIVLRSPHSPSNIASHLNDLAAHVHIPELVAGGTTVLVLLVDGGPDFNCNHGINAFHYARFFKQMNLDALLVTSYCPGDSAMNPIEHLWAPCTRALTSVYLPSTLPDEDTPPCQQKISAEEKKTKEHVVFNNAMEAIKDVHWKNLKYAKRKVTVEIEQSGADPHPYGQDFDIVKEAIGGSARRLRQSAFNEEFLFSAKHMDKRIGTLIMTKCDEATCLHCTAHPPLVASSDMDLLRAFPSPQPSSRHPDHFLTFIEAAQEQSCPPCEHLPQFREKALGRCPSPECRYVFTSRKDIDDHRRKVHGR